MNHFSDIFKRSFLEGFTSASIGLGTAVTAMCTTLLVAVYIYLVYRLVTRKTFYSNTFALSLVGVALITSAIIVTIQSSVVVSLGMVGALSIVRFRTAVKNPIDLMFLFWAISSGIICGAGFAGFALCLSFLLTLSLLVLDHLPQARAPMLLVINAVDPDAEERILPVVRSMGRAVEVKARSMTSAGLDLTLALRTDRGSELVRSLLALEGVTSACLMTHEGETTF